MNNSMEICAGTSQGVFVVSEGAAKQVLRSRDVRELVRIGGRCFAGTGDGLHVSDDCGRTWVPSGLEGREVWAVRADDGGRTWTYAWKGITPRYSRPMCIDHRAPYGLTVASAPTAHSNYRQENGAQAMLFRSENGGESWRSLCDETHSPSAANFHGLTVDPEVPGGVLVGTDTGEVWRVSDCAEWELCGEGMPTVLSLAAMA